MGKKNVSKEMEILIRKMKRVLVYTKKKKLMKEGVEVDLIRNAMRGRRI